MDTSVIVDTISNAIITYPVLLWSNLVTTFGTIPALIISFTIVVGTYTVGKLIIQWIINKIKNLFKKKEVRLPSQTY